MESTLTHSKLVLARKSIGLSQMQLSRALSIRQAQISVIENDAKSIPFSILEYYVKLGIDVSAVFNMEIDADDFATIVSGQKLLTDGSATKKDWSDCPLCKEKDLQLAGLQLRIKSLEEVADALRTSLKTYQRFLDHPQGG